MRTAWIIAAVGLVLVVLVVLSILGREENSGASAPAANSGEAIRLGLIPERDIFALRRRNQILAEYLSKELKRPVELVTCNSYETVLADFAEKKIEAAFLGSLVSVLAADRMDAGVLLKTQNVDGISSYKGNICVKETSGVTSVAQLRGRSVAMVPTTTAGHLFPMYELGKAGLLEGEGKVRIVWVGTHDEAIQALVRGDVDAAAVKDLRMAAWQSRNIEPKLKVIAQSYSCPENALVVRRDVAETLGRQIAGVLLAMDQSQEGRNVLQDYGASKFLPCQMTEYAPICRMINEIGPGWSALGIAGPPPERICRELGH